MRVTAPEFSTCKPLTAPSQSRKCFGAQQSFDSARTMSARFRLGHERIKTENAANFQCADERFLQRLIEFRASLHIVRNAVEMEMSQVASPTAPWDIQAARALYNINRWGAKYFDINDAGHVVAMPLRENGAVVDLTDVIEEAKGRGLKFPVLIRFQDILRDRVEAINQAFAASIAEFNYQNNYRGVFPIKVNQLREVVEEILDAGKPYQFGLEVGSKPELFAGLALQNQPGCLIICNGYKDALFIRMALMGIKLGKKVVMVVEKLEELRQIITVSRQMGVEPLIGIRVRLISKGAGKWADSGGENAKFGLNTAELLAATRNSARGKNGALLQAAPFPHRLAGAGHSHHQKSRAGGGPLLRQALQNGFRHRVARRRRRFGRGLRRQPVGFRQFDQLHLAGIHQRHCFLHRRSLQPGAGAASANHQRKRTGHRRASQRFAGGDVGHHRKNPRRRRRCTYGEKEHALVRDLLDIRKNLPRLNKLEAFHDASDRREEAQNMFALGLLDLPDKAKIETLYWEIGREVVQSFRGQRLRAGGNPQAGGQPGRPVPVQFFRLPIPAGPLGAWASFSRSCP